MCPSGGTLNKPTHSLEYLGRYFGNEATARALLSRLGITPDGYTRYTEETLQEMRGLRAQPSVVVPPPSVWLSLEAAGKELDLTPAKVFNLIGKGLVGTVERLWTQSTVEQSSVRNHHARMRQEAARAAQETPGLVVAPVKQEPVVLPPAPVWEEPNRPRLRDVLKARVSGKVAAHA
jgi:hypothetical protein